MEYDIAQHGDRLERNYNDFIRSYLPNYEQVWKTFIGNDGNDEMAPIDGYEFNDDRKSFSEHSYTVLESLIQLKRMIDNKVFEDKVGADFEKLLDLKNNIITFFTHLGRINDNLEDAASKLQVVSVKDVKKYLAEFYHKRHLVVHGKALPFSFNEEDEMLIPQLSIDGTDAAGWNHKRDKWEAASGFEKQTIDETASQLFGNLVGYVNSVYGSFYSAVKKLLGTLSISVDIKPLTRGVGVSGWERNACNATTVVTSNDGSHGSSGNPNNFN